MVSLRWKMTLIFGILRIASTDSTTRASTIRRRITIARR